jgi:signal transduction histidine kinase/DNA-binding response OmpR family regulator
MPNDVMLPINGYIRDMVEDREGNVWIATHGGGIAVFSPALEKFTIYNTGNSKLPIDKVQSLLEDRYGQIWAATLGGGLALFHKKTNDFTVYSEKDGLQNSSVFKVLEDQQGLIWVSTNKGISSLDASTKKINNYDYHNGIQRNSFMRGSGIKLSTGELFFGGLEGFNYFHPSALIKNNNVPAVVITDLRISNRSVAPSEDGPIQEHISVADEINLDYKQNFALDFVGLNYTAPEKNQYAYKLEGFDKDWNYVGNVTSASYTNLDPGEYVFRIRASNNDGVWNNEGRSIKVHVHPPFWLTVYAYIFYALIPIGLVLYLRHRGIIRIKRKYALEQEKLVAEQERRETERIRELDALKIKFLTNLSHDFRTPISLILGPVDTLLGQQKDPPASVHLQMIKRNAKRLLNLVNQLLDFRKMEEHELKLNLSEGELISFLKETSDSFKDLSERKKIEFAFSNKIEKLYTLFDHDKLERILFNILSNAFKFTLEGGKIAVAVEAGEEVTDESITWVTLKVSDTGIGIPADKKEKIFELFFQNTTAAAILNQGTGIGLSITKEFVKMHGGTIDVDSKQGKGTTFSIHLPFTRLEALTQGKEIMHEPIVAATETELEDEQIIQQEQQTEPEKTTVLLVEDNDDFRFYLKDNLRLHYKVLEAANGKEGWQKALAQHPQLIVSDINMPGMDGIELCKKIKADKRTGHIPVILLTALTGEEDQLRGLQTGANDYISKPFNFELLNARIKNLLALNNTFKKTYTKQIKALAPEIEIQSGDEILLQTIHQYLEDNLTNPQLSVEELSRHVGMSRSSLYNKLLEVTGQTPVEYIRSVKLDKAIILLQKSDMNIAQIAYSVGFSTPNYFAKSFKAKYNMLPSEYMLKMRKENQKNNF